MTHTPQAAAAWMQGGPARTINSGDWEGGCVAAVYIAGQFSRSYDFAVQAAVAAGAKYAGGHALPMTGTLSTDPNAAVDGSVHYWGGIWNSASNRWDGHVGFQYGGRIYMASSYARVQYGHHLGSSTWAQYDADRGLPYLGHGRTFGTQPFAGVFPASSNVSPLTPDPATKKDYDMPQIWARQDAGKWTYALFDAEHWEETSDSTVASHWCFEWNAGNSPLNITGNAGYMAAWNYRSNERPDLKIPFGVKAAASGAVTIPPLTIQLTGTAKS